MSFMLLGILNSQASDGGLANSYDHIQTVKLSTTTNSVTFSGIGALTDYTHLQFRIVSHASNSGSGAAAYHGMYFNGDASTNKTIHTMQTFNGNPDVFNVNNQNRIKVGVMPSTFGSQNNLMFAPTIVDINDFASTNKNKTVRFMSALDSYTQDMLWFGGGAWYSTAAITSVTFDVVDSSNYVAESRFSLYGIKAV
jgi:hypothetical protein